MVRREQPYTNLALLHLSDYDRSDNAGLCSLRERRNG